MAELVLCAAMVAMTSPVGAPIPAAGWQAVLVLTLGWSVTTRRPHHLAATATMLFMLTAMPHSGDHGPWLTMRAMGHGWWTPLTFAAAAWFLLEAAHAIPAWRTDPTHALPRTGMSLGMACALVMSA